MVDVTPEDYLAGIGVREVELPETARRNGDARTQPKAPRFTLTAFKSIKLQTTALYLIKDLLPSSGLVVIWGPPKCGKSFWATDALMHVALGWEYRGRRVRQGVVVYCALEGSLGFRKRVEAFRLSFLADDPGADPPFLLMDQPLALVADHAAFVASIRTQLADRRPAAVCIDTLNRSLTGSESSDEDMSSYIKAADAIRDAFGCLVVIVHHCGHNGDRPRGHSSLIGALDVQIAVRREQSGQVVAELELSKDGPVGLVLASQLEPIQVGVDEDGDAITSCVIKPVDLSETAKAATPGAKKPPSKASVMRRAFVDTYTSLAIDVKPSPGFDKSPVRKVRTDSIRDEMRARGYLAVDEAGNLTVAARSAFMDAKTKLFHSKTFVENDGLVWQVAANN